MSVLFLAILFGFIALSVFLGYLGYRAWVNKKDYQPEHSGEGAEPAPSSRASSSSRT